MQKIHSKTLIPERGVDFNSAIDKFKKIGYTTRLDYNEEHKSKKTDKFIQKEHSKTLIPERGVDFDSALNIFKKLTSKQQSLDLPNN